MCEPTINDNNNDTVDMCDTQKYGRQKLFGGCVSDGTPKCASIQLRVGTRLIASIHFGILLWASSQTQNVVLAFHATDNPPTDRVPRSTWFFREAFFAHFRRCHDFIDL